jgi:hypothetical protein
VGADDVAVGLVVDLGGDDPARQPEVTDHPQRDIDVVADDVRHDRGRRRGVPGAVAQVDGAVG